MAAPSGTRAIILAAGVGRRLGALTAHRPKCLLPLDGETLLERQLRLLAAAGLSDIAVVGGFEYDQLAARLAGRVRLLVNADYAAMGSVRSLQAAAAYLEGSVVVLNSDLVYGRPLLDALLAADGPYTLLVHPGQRHTAGIGVALSGSRVADIGRHIPSSLHSGAFSGAACVEAGGMQRFRAAVLACDPRRKDIGWSAAFASLIRDGCRVDARRYEGPVFDVNSVAAYAAAKEWVASGSPEPAAHR